MSSMTGPLDHRIAKLLRDFRLGFSSPLKSLKFFTDHKRYLVIGLAPQLLGIIGLLTFVNRVVLVKTLDFLERNKDSLSSWPLVIVQILESITGPLTFLLLNIVGLMIYAIILAPLVNAMASPLYDLVAEKAFEVHFGSRLPKLSWNDFLRSLFSECSKALIVLTLVLLTFFIPVFGILSFVLSLWFLGWDAIDRTLGLLGWPLRRRILFGFLHFPTCLGLGLWSYFPVIGTLMSFGYCASGAICVAKIGKEEGLTFEKSE